MRLERMLFTLIGPAVFFAAAVANFVLFPYSKGDGTAGNAIGDIAGFGNLVTISTACQQALNSTITCDPIVQQLAVNGYSDSLNYTGTAGSSYATVCATTCTNSLNQYTSSVKTACGTSTAIFGGLPPTYRGDIIWQWQNTTCQKDTATGLYCADFVLNQMATYTGSTSIDYTDLPTSILCAPCQISRWRALQSSPYSGYDEEKQTQWIKVQQRCGLSYPTAIPADFVFTLPNAANSTSTLPPGQASCLSGHTYVVKSGDTCHSIAGAQSVAEGTLRLINQILPDCSNIAVGQSLCLPSTCSTYLFKAGDTCAAIAGALGIETGTLIGYNAAINQDCSNSGLNGTYICITSPFGEYTPVLIEGTSTNSGIYAESALPAPGTLARGTTKNCGKYYQVADGDICQVISLNMKISLDLFSQINPSINAACDNLVVNLWYCVQPTEDWQDAALETSTAGTRTTVPPPAPTESGTHDHYRYYNLEPNHNPGNYEQDHSSSNYNQIHNAGNHNSGNHNQNHNSGNHNQNHDSRNHHQEYNSSNNHHQDFNSRNYN
ncbi:hypothetical protein ABW20_dc0110447 [Dactylellina cionopaga]|nr:hypothetical protein ABW20_dc0110447 [Dactylellina cionopaga]